MLAVTQYPKAYVDQVRARFAAATGGDFNLLVLALDHHFMHRVRNREGKDGNPINEVRMLSDSLMEHDGVLTANTTIKYKPEHSVLGIAIGDTIAIDEDGFRRLTAAFLDEIETRYGATAAPDSAAR